MAVGLVAGENIVHVKLNELIVKPGLSLQTLSDMPFH